MSIIPPVPSGVTLLVERLSGDLASLAVNAEVLATHVRGQRWRVTAVSPRVTMWVEVEPLPRKRLKWQAGEFWIDGVKKDRHDYDATLRTFAEHSEAGRADDAVTDVPLDCAPAPVSRMVRALRSATDRAGMRASVARSGNVYTVALLSTRARIELRLREKFDFLRPARPPEVETIASVGLWVDGVDRSDIAGKTLDSALRAAMQTIAAPPPPSVPRERQAAVNTGVQVRKKTVIRN
jgi:hypothetical protein